MLRLRPIPLLEAAPWIGEGLEPEEFESARRHLIVARVALSPGPWEWSGPDPDVGFLILRGRIARGLRLEDAPAHGVEILGEGDLMRPWTFRGETGSIPSTADWTVMTRMEVAILDANFLRAVGHWPALAINMLDLAVERTRTLAFFLTARQVSRLEARILLTFWHLADRWGHVTPEGVTLELPKLTHEMIARMVAARRPSVTTGIRQLRELGLVEARPGGRWLLRGDPVEALRTIRERLDAPG